MVSKFIWLKLEFKIKNYKRKYKRKKRKEKKGEPFEPAHSIHRADPLRTAH